MREAKMENDGGKMRDKLQRVLYLKARELTHKDYRNDPESVKIKRDSLVDIVCKKDVQDLTIAELNACITYAKNAIEEEAGSEPAPVPTAKDEGEFKMPIKEKYATKNQLHLLNFYSLQCALIYANFKEAKFHDPATNDIYSGEDIRNLIIKAFSESKSIPSSILSFLYLDWINPKSNQMLLEGGYRKFVKNTRHLYYEKLYYDEAQYLIKRYSQIYLNLELYKKKQDNNFLKNLTISN